MATLGYGVRFTPTAGGLTDFVNSSTVTGYRAASNLVTTKTYRYRAESADLSQWEWGTGTWTSGTSTLARTTILDSSNAGAKVNFTNPPQVAIVAFIEDISFDVGAALLFFQAAAPTGWTKDTTNNDKALRVVSGTGGGVGGVNSFSTTFASRTSDATTISTAQMPSHAHATQIAYVNGGTVATYPYANLWFNETSTIINSASTGGGSSHTHTYDMRVQYMDVIVCTRNAA